MRRLATALLAAALALVASTIAPAAVDPDAAGLQVALRAQGYYDGPIDGVAGPATNAGVVRFQREAGLVPDGVAGPLTRKALGVLGRPRFGKRVLLRGRVGWDVSVLQFLLGRSGAWTAPDGDFGGATERSVRRFQRKSRLAVDGVAGPFTRRALLEKPPPSAPERHDLATPEPQDVATPEPKDVAAPEHRGIAAPIYVVQAGDSLSAIATRYGTTVAELAALNRFDPAHVILVGQRLLVPSSGPSGDGPVQALLDRYAERYGVSRSLVRALAWQESGFQPDVVSVTGAWGVMQVMPETWEWVEEVLLGEPVPTTTAGNVQVGVLYLRHLLDEFDGDEAEAVAAYYQGSHSVRRSGPLAETRAYVANVLSLERRA
jgi:peptidoglycan hydrolase-like protein with peptidoglycan-binding domain/LysM repeat protein